MSKKKYKKNRDGLIVIGENGQEYYATDTTLARSEIFAHYNDKFFNKFLNKFEFEGINYQQINYIMRKFWGIGTTCATIRKGWNLIEEQMKPEDKIVFTPYTPSGKYGIYDFFNKLHLVNSKGVVFIDSSKEYTLDEDAVIGFIQRNKKGVFSSIKAKLAQLVDIEMTIRTNMKSQKYPIVVGVEPEDEANISHIMDMFEEDEPIIFAKFAALKNAKALVSGAPYILDKLYMLKQSVENEILTILGINNLGVLNKKEHLTAGEVDINNEEIGNSSDEFLTCLEEFFDRIKKTLGYDIKVRLKNTDIYQEDEIEVNKEEEENE